MEFYRAQSGVTDPGAMRHLFQGLPPDVRALSEVLGGLMVHRDQTAVFGFELPPERRGEADIRFVADMLAWLGSLDARPPSERLAGTCRDFAVLLCAMLRGAGVPARARAGFAGYFGAASSGAAALGEASSGAAVTGEASLDGAASGGAALGGGSSGQAVSGGAFVDGAFFDDHWTVEVWDEVLGWHLVDAQVASAPPGTYTAADFDPFDVSRDAFLVGGQAWAECRSGGRDLSLIGTSAAGLTGLWEVQGNVIRDLASLAGAETLPWDNWGLIPVHYDELPSADVALLDRVAEVSAAGGPLDEADRACRSDPRLPVPPALARKPG